MLKRIDQAAAVAFAVLAAGHGFVGTLAERPFFDGYTVWSFSGSIAAWMIAAVNFARAGRSGDMQVAWIALAGVAAWVVLMVWLAESTGMWSDPRIWLWFANSAVLLAFSARSIVPPAQVRAK